ncbi:30S ribosomal protein S16 [candidate division WWE3 bacterium RIFCSPLOWO2_01_FULL_39_13]|uniref:Small ribosomal subunit protein bS16 n=1 Tax=candidate division WWE3 bacterium RIFCSPLOWO2_01_FULL_39_13 TaxID=1802624 RepID=A0A1F4V1J9_UNCKA|nr:MAG: 30S ribosomal protein S16 [candidate division WWE3 bacterium RIFCSPLOWO2_01_FULL_39_13]
MLRIRLSRVGRKNAPAYRIVVIDRKSKRDGKNQEIIGSYNPTENPDKVEWKKDRYEYWKSKGAQPSHAVLKLISGKYKYTVYNPKQAKKDEEAQKTKDSQTQEAPPESAKIEPSKSDESKATTEPKAESKPEALEATKNESETADKKTSETKEPVK